MIEDRKVFYIDADDLSSDDAIKLVSKVQTELADVEYLRQKLASALEQDPASAEKARRQLELLEDALVVYKLSHGERK